MSKDFMAQSIDQGIEFLKEKKPQIVQFSLPNGAWNFAGHIDAMSVALEAAIDKDIGHSGSSFGYALKGVFAKAQEELGYRLIMTDGAAPQDPKASPVKIASLVLKS